MHTWTNAGYHLFLSSHDHNIGKMGSSNSHIYVCLSIPYGGNGGLIYQTSFYATIGHLS
jgi:hypothetical protein